MDDLFRYMVMRAPLAVARTRSTSMARPTDLQQVLAGLRNDLQSPDPRPAMVLAAESYQNRETFSADATRWHPYQRQLRALRAALQAAKGPLKPTEVPRLVHEHLGSPAIKVVADEAFQSAATRLYDTIVALFLDPSRHRRWLPALLELAQMVAVVELAGRGELADVTSPASERVGGRIRHAPRRRVARATRRPCCEVVAHSSKQYRRLRALHAAGAPLSLHVAVELVLRP